MEKIIESKVPQPTIKRCAQEIAWAVSNAMIDSDDKEIGNITLSCLVKVRDIVEIEVMEQLKELLEKENAIQQMLNKI